MSIVTSESIKDADMYGVIPRENILTFSISPPENMLKRLKTPEIE
jgi:hypothetical protein